VRRADFIIAAIVLCSALSCDDRDGPITGGIPFEPPPRPTVEMRIVTQLQANRNTHFTVDQIGNVYWTQENEVGENVVLSIGESGVPRATRLSSGNILKEMGAAGGEGIIQDIRAAEGAIWFYFTGGKGRASRTCLGQFFPRTGNIRIVADTARLAEVSGMGTSLDLARASLVLAGDKLWLWLRHSDMSTFLALDPREARTSGEIVSIQRPFDHVTVEERRIVLTREDIDIAAGQGGTLLLLDTKNGLIWEVDVFGRATMRIALTGVPNSISAPVIVKDQLVLFAGESDPMGDPLAILNATHLPKIQYPALLKIVGDKIVGIQRDDLQAYSGFPVYAMRVQRLVREAPDRLIAYDAASGALMRLTIPKDW
jgi:hypothetical protein